MLWSPLSPDGTRTALAAAVAVCPHQRDSGAAESVGLTLGLAFARACPSTDPLSILGDNLPLIRFAACNGRMRADSTWQLASASIMGMAHAHHRISWEAVRRCFNKGADKLTTIGVKRAQRGQREEILYEADPTFPRNAFSLAPIACVTPTPGLRWLCSHD